MFLYGASGHARVIIDIILSSSSYRIKKIYDDFSVVKEIFNIPVDNDMSKICKDDIIIISIGNNQIRKQITTKIDAQYYTAIHPDTVISNLNTIIEEGTVIMPNVVINANTIIGKHCIINTAAVIEHDCIIADFVHISPNAALAGGVSVGEGSQIGIGANVIPGVKIGKWCIIGAGSTVINDVPDYSVEVGSPATFIKKNNLII